MLITQLTRHLDETCNEYEMICPMEKTKGCDYKVRLRAYNVLHVKLILFDHCLSCSSLCSTLIGKASGHDRAPD